MRQLTHRVAGEQVTINIVDPGDDPDDFRDFVSRGGPLAFDTEGTSLNVFTPSYRLRLAQFGNSREAWVLPVEADPYWKGEAARTLRKANRLYCHNATYDLLVADEHLGVPIEETYHKTVDVRIMSHLSDPRASHEGGVGHGLEDLTRAYIDPVVADEVKGSMRELAKELKTTKAKVFAEVPLDHEGYNRYAGMDPILTSRVFDKMLYTVPKVSRPLVTFEHKVAFICALMERKGFLLDEHYTRYLVKHLTEQEDKYTEIAAKLGCENINSTEQVAVALEARGVRLTERTPSGKVKVDKAVLNQLVAQGDMLAEAIQKAKRAGKWRKTYAESFLELMSTEGRIHCGINSLQARTARMSITRPALQTLPSSDSLVRSCFLADEGELVLSIDYQAIELRVLAALSQEKRMIKAILAGEDLHGLTASLVFGPNYTDKQRKAAKILGFGKVYGGGAATLARQTGLSLEEARRVIKAYDEGYPSIKAYADHLQKSLRGNRFGVVTRSGRWLPVDRERPYAALNFMIQSTARDILAQGLINIYRAGLIDYLRLPVHDEVVASAPEAEAEEVAHAIAEAMASEVNGVPIATDPEVGGRSWGSLYQEAA